MNEIIEYAAIALKEFSAERIITPIRAALSFHNDQNISLIMPSVAEKLNSVGVKFVNVDAGNQKLGKKTMNGVVIY
ncbi:Alanine dehydrogenase [Bacillus cereus]|nr:Alanine dehydrogenase [Bacillus cereus]